MAPHCLHLPYPWGYSLPSASILARVFSALLLIRAENTRIMKNRIMANATV